MSKNQEKTKKNIEKPSKISTTARKPAKILKNR